MVEGTKLGEDKNLELDPSHSVEKSVLGDEDQATKLGEISDFEKTLFEDKEVQEPDSESQAGDVAGDVLDEKAEEPQIQDSQDLDKSLDDLFEDALDDTLVNYQEGDVISGAIRAIEKSGLLVDIKYKSDGYVPNAEFSSDYSLVPTSSLKIGDAVDVLIEKLETKEGYTLLSCKKAEFELNWTKLEELFDKKEVFNVKVMSQVQGGLVVTYLAVKGFIPLSHMDHAAKENIDALIGRDISVVVLHIDRNRRKVVFSNRLAKSRPNVEEVDRLLKDLEVGQVKKGKVSSIKDFGAFIDIGGIEGLAHISELSWSRVSHPSEILEVGQDVDVFILGIDHDKKRISFGLKQLQEDPWVKAAEQFSVGQTVEGSVSRIVSFGAFVELDNDLEGLIHISEFTGKHVNSVSDIIAEGDKVTVKIIRLQPEEQKIGLSIKALNEGMDITTKEVVVEEATEEVVVEEVTEEVVVEEVTEEVVVEEVTEEVGVEEATEEVVVEEVTEEVVVEEATEEVVVEEASEDTELSEDSSK